MEKIDEQDELEKILEENWENKKKEKEKRKESERKELEELDKILKEHKKCFIVDCRLTRMGAKTFINCLMAREGIEVFDESKRKTH